MIGLTYYQRSRDLIMNRATNYHENDKKRSEEQARDKYRNWSEEEENEKERIWKKQIS